MASTRPPALLTLVRHAPTDAEGRVCGRRDLPARLDDGALLKKVRIAAGDPAARISSPALRCRQTAAALWPDLPPARTDARLWEQDFGDWEGAAYADLPELGPLTPAALAAHRPPAGESFEDVCRRVAPALHDLADAAASAPVVVVAHAGVIRAALALALGATPPALAFEAAPLSLTRLRPVGAGAFAIVCTNWLPE